MKSFFKFLVFFLTIFLVKLGIYPWGTTFVEGTLEELEKFIKTIVEEEINKPNYACPFCKSPYSLRDLDREIFVCKCGAKLIKADCRSSEHIHNNCAFEEIKKTLTPFERKQVEFFIFKNRFFVEEVFKNVKFAWIDGWQGYWIKGEKPIIRKEYEIYQLRPVEHKLIKEGYEILATNSWFCSIWENKKGHKIIVEYDDFEAGKPVQYSSIWIEVKGILTNKQIWNFQDKTGADYAEEISEMLDGEMTWSSCEDEYIDAIPVKPEEFLNADLEKLKQELEKRFSLAQLKVLKKYNLTPEDLET